MLVPSIIAAHGLQEWWSRLSNEERMIVEATYDAVYGDQAFKESRYVSQHAAQFLAVIGRSMDYSDLMDRVFNYAEQITDDPVELHFLFMTAWRRYKQHGNFELQKSYLNKDCAIYDAYILAQPDYLQGAIYPSFKELALLLERAGEYEEAISISKAALSKGVKEDTSFDRRIAKLLKLSASN